MTKSRLARRSGAIAALVSAATLMVVATLAAHDFWLVPSAMTFAPGEELHILGQSGTRFPRSSGATQPAQVVEARLISASRNDRLTDLTVSGRSLLIRQKPAVAGQHVVAVSLTPRNARTTPERLRRYLALEGAPELAARYEGEASLARMDSVMQTTAKFAKTIVEVGSRGRRAFDKTAGHALELVPLRDPAALRAGDSLGVRLLYRGKPVSGVHLRAGWGSPTAVNDSTAPQGQPAESDQTIVTDDKGVARLRITDAGLWNVRVLYATSMAGMAEHWEVFFATLVFAVNDAQ